MLLVKEQLPDDLSEPLLAEAAREAVDQLREEARGGGFNPPSKEIVLNLCLALTKCLYHRKQTPSLRRVINATGIVLHTNLGRAPMARAAADAIAEVAHGYSNLELDLDTGKRASRYDHVRDLLCRLTGAEDALVVNNNAAAVLLALDTLASGGEAIVSRGELVEIGGSFRIPDILEKTGVTLREVGCTNKTHLDDYRAAITDKTKLLLKVHPSNFAQVGFVEEVDLETLVALGRESETPVLYDLGSGCLYSLAEEGVGGEPMVPRVLASGVDVVCFSGDKLLGGPQAGIILGRRAYIEEMKQNHLTRALRIDKFTLAALEATLRLYVDPQKARQEIPTLEMILAPPEILRTRAEALAAIINQSGHLCRAEVRPGKSEVGGGSLPGLELDTSLVYVQTEENSAEELVSTLRTLAPPILAYIRDNHVILDPRTLQDGEEQQVAAQIIHLCRGAQCAPAPPVSTDLPVGDDAHIVPPIPNVPTTPGETP